MYNIRKDTKHTGHISRRIHLVRNGEECSLHHTVWCEGCLQLEDIGINNFRADEFNPRLRYDMVIFDN